MSLSAFNAELTGIAITDRNLSSVAVANARSDGRTVARDRM